MTEPLPTPMTFTLSRITLERVEFSHVRGVFAGKQAGGARPAEMQVSSMMREDGKEAVVRLEVWCDNEEADYNYRISYLVFLGFEGDRPEDFDRRLSVTGAKMAYPFVRELLANLSGRAMYRTSWLNPVNLDTLQEVEQPETDGEAEASEEKTP